MLALFVLVAAVATPTPEPIPTLSPNQTLARVRQVFRSHRPPPAFEKYTVERKQLRADGYPDVTDSYTFHVWVRNGDRAAMKRKVFRDNYEYLPEFDRPAFNEDRDPGPPTADVFEPKPAVPHPVSQPYTPEPASSQPQIIGRISTLVELDYRVIGLTTDGALLHLTLEPMRDVSRNRLTDVYVDKTSYEVKKLVAHDTLFVRGGPGGEQKFGVIFTITMGEVDGIPVVTSIHGIVGDGYTGDGKDVDYQFRDITFPKMLPEWYFDPRTYAQHANETGPS